jgi:putative thioredoxin
LLAKVNVDDNPGLAVRFGVQGIPAVKAYHHGEVVAQFTGAAPEQTVRQFLQRVAPGEAEAVISEATSLLATRHWEQAEDKLRTVLDSQPRNPAATLGLVRTLIAQGKGDTALAFIEDFPASSEIVAAQQLQPLAKLLAEVEHGNGDDIDEVDPLEARGQHAAAMDGLLEVLRQDKGFRKGEPRMVILGVFALLGDDDPLTPQYRDELAGILF